MRRRGGVPKRQKSLSIQTKEAKKKISALLFPLSFNTTVGPSSLLLFAEKKNSLSLLFCRPPPHCVKANNNTKR